MNAKRLARILLFAFAFLAGVAYGQEPTVIPLNPIEIYLKPPHNEDELNKEFLALLSAKMKSQRGVFKLVDENDSKQCVVIFVAAPIHSNIGLRGYSLSYNIVTKRFGDLNLDTMSITAPTLPEIVDIAVKETLRILAREEVR